VAAAIVAIASAVGGAYRGLRKVYRQTIGSRRDLARRLNQIAAGVTCEYVEARFGPPAFARPFKRSPDLRDLAMHVRELTYREKHAWLQTLVDRNNAVLRFSITVTDPKFKFQIRDLTFGHLTAKLGHSRFGDLKTWASPEGRNLRIGAHNHEYAEAYYFGNPGNYQHYVVSNNDATLSEFGYPIQSRGGPGWHQDGILQFDDLPPIGNQEFDPEAPYATSFRADTVINSLTVLGPLGPPELLAEPRGPDSNQVRVLMPTPGERRRNRRAIRRANRQMKRAIARQPDLMEEEVPDSHSPSATSDA
jgi:hypothetical protein